MGVKTAIILAAGYGTRMFPVTKTISKEMLPIGNRPIIDYVVEDCVQAGVENIIFVVLEDETQITDYYSPLRPEIIDHFTKRDAQDKLDAIEDIDKKANFTSVVQPNNAMYGTARPIIDVEDSIGLPSSFFYLYGDALFWNAGKSEVGEMAIQAYEHNCLSAVMTKVVSMDKVSSYGVIERNEKGHFKRIVEKPTIEEAPSNHINAGEYLLESEFVNFAREVTKSSLGEYLITDAFEPYAKEHNTYIYESNGAWLDVGTPESFAASQSLVN